MMDVVFTKTGSKENASVVSDGKTIIMIDSGIKPDTISKNTNYKLSELDGIIITHEHLD